jgi:hypothetical protein
MMLEEFKQLIPGLSDKSHSNKIKLFGWYLHVHKRMTQFQPSDIGNCYDALHMARPSQFGGYFADLLAPGKGLLKDRSGYRLESKVRAELDAQYGSREITIQVTELLLGLPEKISDLAERTYLDEALICFRHKAFRAAVVMTWNLAYHHLCDYVLKNRLDDFNKRWPLVYQGHHRKGTKTIATMDDLTEELKESEVIEICNSAGIITKDVHRILVGKLGRRNSAAHPSSVMIEQLQAEEFIDDLIKNVVLKLK